MPHQLKLAVDGVVDANYVFTDIGRLRNGRNKLTGAKVRFREGACIQFEDRIRVDQVGGDDITGKRLPGSQTVALVDQKLCRVTGRGNDRRRASRGDRIGQRLSGSREIAGVDRVSIVGALP